MDEIEWIPLIPGTVNEREGDSFNRRSVENSPQSAFPWLAFFGEIGPALRLDDRECERINSLLEAERPSFPRKLWFAARSLFVSGNTKENYETLVTKFKIRNLSETEKNEIVGFLYECACGADLGKELDAFEAAGKIYCKLLNINAESPKSTLNFILHCFRKFQPEDSRIDTSNEVIKSIMCEYFREYFSNKSRENLQQLIEFGRNVAVKIRCEDVKEEVRNFFIDNVLYPQFRHFFYLGNDTEQGTEADKNSIKIFQELADAVPRLSLHDPDFIRFTSLKNNEGYYYDLRKKIYEYFDGPENLAASIQTMALIFLENQCDDWKDKLVSELVENQSLLKGLSSLIPLDLDPENLVICFVVSILTAYPVCSYRFEGLIFECVHEAQQRLESS